VHLLGIISDSRRCCNAVIPCLLCGLPFAFSCSLALEPAAFASRRPTERIKCDLELGGSNALMAG